MSSIRENEKKFFLRALKKTTELYDPEWKGPREYLASAHYHISIHHCFVHGIFDAMVYANGLLAAGGEENIKTAVEIFDKTCHLQDQDPSSPTFGIWSWYMEEPLEQMCPPCWNFADFDGKEIIKALLHHGDRFPAPLKKFMEKCVRCAALSIYRRNVLPGYTNISLMGCYVTLMAAQMFDWEDMTDYGMSKLKRAWKYNMENKSFAEYNSATYTPIAIAELSRIRDDVKNPEAKKMAEDMLDLAWKTVAEHYHAPTGQWAGPNSRSYSYLTDKKALSFLRHALENESLVSDEEYQYDLPWAYEDISCPEKYRSMFTDFKPHSCNLVFSDSDDLKAEKQAATSYLAQDFCLSSWETCDTWNQRRNLLGFWGKDEPRFIDAAILHDLYDFSSGVFCMAQHEGNVLLSVGACTDAGDTHCNLDMIRNETIRAYDLRARIELGGSVQKPVVRDQLVTLEDGGISLRMELLAGEANGQPLHFELFTPEYDRQEQHQHTRMERRYLGKENRWYVDVVFYHGEEKDISLSQIQKAYAVIAVSMTGHPAENVKIREEKDRLEAFVQMNGHTLSLSAPLKPVPRKNWQSCAFVDEMPVKKRIQNEM